MGTKRTHVFTIVNTVAPDMV